MFRHAKYRLSLLTLIVSGCGADAGEEAEANPAPAVAPVEAEPAAESAAAPEPPANRFVGEWDAYIRADTLGVRVEADTYVLSMPDERTVTFTYRLEETDSSSTLISTDPDGGEASQPLRFFGPNAATLEQENYTILLVRRGVDANETPRALIGEWVWEGISHRFEADGSYVHDNGTGPVSGGNRVLSIDDDGAVVLNWLELPGIGTTRNLVRFGVEGAELTWTDLVSGDSRTLRRVES